MIMESPKCGIEKCPSKLVRKIGVALVGMGMRNEVVKFAPSIN